MLEEREAFEIADNLLYQTGKCLMSGDFEGMASHFHLPYFLETADGRRKVTTTEEMSDLFEDVRKFHRENGVTDLVRTVISANVLSPDAIGSTHVSRLIGHDSTPMKDPFPTYSLINLLVGDWKIASSIYVVLDNPGLSDALANPQPQQDTDR